MSEITVYTAAIGPDYTPRTDIKCYTKCLPGFSNQLSVKVHKALSQNQKTKYTIWVDSNVWLKQPPEAYIELLGDKPIGVFPHWHRDCLYDEAAVCIKAGLDDPATIRAQLVKYWQAGFPANAGLGMCFLIVRRDTMELRRLNHLWLEEIKNNSIRDQISFPYVYRVQVKYFPPVPGNDNEYYTRIAMKFPESKLAHKLLDDLVGIEIGGSAHNAFNLPRCKNVDYTDDMETVFKISEQKLCGEKMAVDIVANGDDLPLEDESIDYVVSSHVIEHFFDPIAALQEWFRVIRPGGYIFIIAPKSRALPQETRPCTSLQEMIDRHEGRMKPEDVDMTLDGQTDHGHWSVWDLQDFLPIIEWLNWTVLHALETDDKVGNGFCVVIQKPA